jgi:hypothetical protein
MACEDTPKYEVQDKEKDKLIYAPKPTSPSSSSSSSSLSSFPNASGDTDQGWTVDDFLSCPTDTVEKKNWNKEQ